MNGKERRNLVERAINEVRKKGDEALFAYARKFDTVSLSRSSLRVNLEDFKRAYQRLSPATRQSLKNCASRIAQFHKAELKRFPRSWVESKGGVRLGQIIQPVASVGVYVPGGRFAYPSTLLMSALPAKLAGVKRIVVVTPPARLSDDILAAAYLAGVTELYRVGGPAAIAALAVGTETISRVDLIVGPGNALVTEAKRQLFGEVGIDLLAGPSELVVIADHSAPPSFVAADLAAQTEHDPEALGVLVSLSSRLIREVKAGIPESLRSRCRFHLAQSLQEAAHLANGYAGEHVEVILKNPKAFLPMIKNGGAIFVNPTSPAVMGDYWAGPSHVLPTGRSARFASDLSAATFFKRSSYIEVSPKAFQNGFQDAHHMADIEGLHHHAQDLRIRNIKERGIS